MFAFKKGLENRSLAIRANSPSSSLKCLTNRLHGLAAGKNEMRRLRMEEEEGRKRRKLGR